MAHATRSMEGPSAADDLLEHWSQGTHSVVDKHDWRRVTDLSVGGSCDARGAPFRYRISRIMDVEYGQAASSPRRSWCGVTVAYQASAKSCTARCSAAMLAWRSCAARSACAGGSGSRRLPESGVARTRPFYRVSGDRRRRRRQVSRVPNGQSLRQQHAGAKLPLCRAPYNVLMHDPASSHLANCRVVKHSDNSERGAEPKGVF